MNINVIKDSLKKNNIIEFKIYSLNYIIEYKENKYIIYPKNDISRKKIL